ncbi:hypothetical protein [uncultured Chryseobacterium sp.]|jgi:hypothetical protein|uniref:hypothetical protein n=1 Tax=uncultured Chryseobacterium sp. TaxID=259322 RepID=UPI0027DE5E0E|nr:hypothetical protein [uncultured Chryseobacterium sp.]
MLTEQEITQIAQDHIDKSGKKSGIKLSLFKEATIKKSYGMIFFYVSKEFYVTRDEKYNTLVGNVPFLVKNVDGEIIEFGSGNTIEYYIQEYEAGRYC